MGLWILFQSCHQSHSVSFHVYYFAKYPLRWISQHAPSLHPCFCPGGLRFLVCFPVLRAVSSDTSEHSFLVSCLDDLWVLIGFYPIGCFLYFLHHFWVLFLKTIFTTHFWLLHCSPTRLFVKDLLTAGCWKWQLFFVALEVSPTSHN